MERSFFPRARALALTGAFHDYLRGVFARLAQPKSPSPAIQRWEGEGGRTR
jgi:hypothetical protein